jgi:RNA polymerase sigma-70 factor, ECF subfamily
MELHQGYIGLWGLHLMVCRLTRFCCQPFVTVKSFRRIQFATQATKVLLRLCVSPAGLQQNTAAEWRGAGAWLGGRLDDSSEALMQRVARGDHAAFARLLERHSSRMLSLARHTLMASSEAEDVVQEAFVRVWQHAARFDAGQSLFTTWLHRIVLNLCLDQLRRPQHKWAELDDAHMEALVDETPNALDQALLRERRLAVHGALRALPMRQRAALVLFHFQAHSVREGATALQLSEKAFESLLNRARSALKAALRPYMHDAGDAP